MKNFIDKYLSLILIIVVLVICLNTFFKMPDNLNEAIDNISEARTQIDSSITLIDERNEYIDSIIQLNKQLLRDLETI